MGNSSSSRTLAEPLTTNKCTIISGSIITKMKLSAFSSICSTHYNGHNDDQINKMKEQILMLKPNGETTTFNTSYVDANVAIFWILHIKCYEYNGEIVCDYESESGKVDLDNNTNRSVMDNAVLTQMENKGIISIDKITNKVNLLL